jgi:hypothetical protein
LTWPAPRGVISGKLLRLLTFGGLALDSVEGAPDADAKPARGPGHGS